MSSDSSAIQLHWHRTIVSIFCHLSVWQCAREKPSGERRKILLFTILRGTHGYAHTLFTATKINVHRIRCCVRFECGIFFSCIVFVSLFVHSTCTVQCTCPKIPCTIPCLFHSLTPFCRVYTKYEKKNIAWKLRLQSYAAFFFVVVGTIYSRDAERRMQMHSLIHSHTPHNTCMYFHIAGGVHIKFTANAKNAFLCAAIAAAI